MEKNIDIAKILKNYPKGTQLYSPLCGECTLCSVGDYIIEVIGTNVNPYHFYSDGTYVKSGECLLFPSKEQRDWSKFQRPFKDGDIIYFITKNDSEYIAIFKNDGNVYLETYIDYSISTFRCSLETSFYIDGIKKQRLATEKEKAKFFQAIKDNGYHWNDEKKTLEKLIEPKFKVGDRIVAKNCSIQAPVSITRVGSRDYYCHSDIEHFVEVLPITEQDKWELSSNKFDLSTLKPFESRVLVRDNYDKWKASFWGCLIDGEPWFKYDTTRGCYRQCIPFEGNEHLLGTNNNCDEFYKTWE